MRSKKKKLLSAKKTARLIADTLWGYLEKLPAKERNKRLDKAHRSMRTRIARAKASSAGSNRHPKSEGRAPVVPVPYAARTER